LQHIRLRAHIQFYAFDVLVRAGGAARLLISDLLEKRRTLYSLTRDAMQECQWLKPVLVAQVAFTEWTPDGHLRQFELRRAAER